MGGKMMFLIMIWMLYGGGVCVFELHDDLFEVYYVYMFGIKVVILLIFVDVKGLFVVVICDFDLVVIFELKFVY